MEQCVCQATSAGEKIQHLKIFCFLQTWNHLCLAFQNPSKRITVVSNGKIVSNDIDEHLLGVDTLVPLKGISIMGGFQPRQGKYTDSLFGKMTDMQVCNSLGQRKKSWIWDFLFGG